jgi:hypothetical protein
VNCGCANFCKLADGRSKLATTSPSSDSSSIAVTLCRYRRTDTDGLSASVEAVYTVDEIGTALTHTQRPARGGKILVTPKWSG